MLQKNLGKEIWDVNVDNIVISKLVKTKINSKYLIGYLDKTVRPLVLIVLKMSGYVKTFKVKERNNKLIINVLTWKQKICIIKAKLNAY